ncbi:hypothetical protein [Nonomuraea basaltis]|uniref:hypothetical protein n=1 Tax=Nonomuraea basaltis TaxID=2495887 RepID=UPI00110C59DC|nr:hypothetical protein [Nonomuraea basaltis]TMR93039.1 hypothetical protein EJK15_41480 [Nonomuraea basaltis]
MKTRPSALLLISAVVAVAACSPSPPPQDRSPLGVVTASPGECGVLSEQAVARATGLADFYASGTNSSTNFKYCVVSKSADVKEPVRLEIQLDDDLAFSLEGLERRRIADKGVPLPSGVGPGYSAVIRGENGQPLGAYASAWTPHDTKLLSITLYQGAPGRDHQADVIEFARQLRPLLLSSVP